MIKLIEKVFINPDAPPAQIRKRYGFISSAVGILLNFLLFVGKAALGKISGSVAVTADAFNNLTDMFTSAVTAVTFKISSAPADKDHPYGHGRAEYIGGFMTSALILAVGLEFVKVSAERIIRPSPPEFSPALAIGLVISVAVKLWMFVYNRYFGRKIDSSALRAVAADSISDAAATSVTLLSAFLSARFSFPFDGAAGILVAFMILKAGYEVAKSTLSPLIGSPPDPGLVKQIETLLTQKPEILGVHDLLVHDYGPGRVYASVHAEVSASGDLLELHEVIDLAEREILAATGVSLVIHIDPTETRDEKTCEAKDRVIRLLAQLYPEFAVHDFRLSLKDGRTTVIFDAEIPYDFPKSDSEIKTELENAVHRHLDKLYASVDVDRK